MPFRLGGVLALIAVTLLAIAIAALPWWKGHPTVDGKEISLVDVDVGLFGGQRCNTGGDGACSRLPLGGGFKTVEALEAAAIIGTMIAGLALAAFAFLSLGPRRLVAKIVIGGGMATALFAIVLLGIGPDVHVSQSVSVPTAVGGWVALAGGVLALVGGVLGGKAEAVVRPRRTPVMPAPISSVVQPGQQPYDMQALLREDGLRPSQQHINGQAPLFSSAPQLRPLYEMPGGGFVPPQPPPMPMRAPTPVIRSHVDEPVLLPPNAPTAAAPAMMPPPPTPSPFGQTSPPLTKTNANLGGATTSSAGGVPLPPPRPGMKTQPPPPRRATVPPPIKATTIGPPLVPPSRPPPAPPMPPALRGKPVPTPPPLSMPTPPPMNLPPERDVIPRGNLIDEDDPDSVSISQPATQDDAPPYNEVGDMTSPSLSGPPSRTEDPIEIPTDRASATGLSEPPDMPSNVAPPLRSSMASIPASGEHATSTVEDDGPRTEAVPSQPPNDDLEDAETPPPVLVPPSGAYGAPLRASSPIMEPDRPSFVLMMSVAGAPATPPDASTQPIPKSPAQPDTVPPVNNEVKGSTPSMPPVDAPGVGAKGVPVAPPGSPTMAIPAPKFPLTTAGLNLPPPKAPTVVAPTSGPSPACPQCESPMTWVEEHLRFYCKSCKMYF